MRREQHGLPFSVHHAVRHDCGTGELIIKSVDTVAIGRVSRRIYASPANSVQTPQVLDRHIYSFLAKRWDREKFKKSFPKCCGMEGEWKKTEDARTFFNELHPAILYSVSPLTPPPTCLHSKLTNSARKGILPVRSQSFFPLYLRLH